ncbi:MAG: hypothetical protein HC905_05005 [Bacteroidales bacterium]|nr:hypothetical protein [Bacteroidales bacterium]
MSTTQAFSQKIKLQTYLDTTKILIGDQLTFTIELEQPEKVKVTFPVFKDTLTSKIEIIEADPADTSRKDDNLVIRKKFLITSFDSGYHKIPPYKFAILIGDQKDTITSQELFLGVNTIPIDTAKNIIGYKTGNEYPFFVGRN